MNNVTIYHTWGFHNPLVGVQGETDFERRLVAFQLGAHMRKLPYVTSVWVRDGTVHLTLTSLWSNWPLYRLVRGEWVSRLLREAQSQETARRASQGSEERKGWSSARARSLGVPEETFKNAMDGQFVLLL